MTNSVSLLRMGQGKNGRRLFSEFLVIVLGVLVALFVDELRDVRADRGLEAQYLERLQGDLSRGRITLDTIRLQLAGASRNADLVGPYLLGGSEMPGDTSTVVAALYRASRSLAPGLGNSLPRTTFLELQATGRIGLIRSIEVRAALLEYYTEVDGRSVTLALLPREYRDFIRRRIPAALQLTVRSECSVFDTAYGGGLECGISLGDFDPRPLLRDVEGNATVAGDLNISRQQMAIGVGLLDALIERTDSLLNLLRRER